METKNEIALIEKMPLNEMMTIADVFAKSGMFADAKTQAQALVKIMAGAELGLPPFASISGVHIILGKPSIGAGLIASRVKGSGKYDYKIVEHTDDKCVIDFFKGKEKIGTESFTIEDAKRQVTKNMDKFPKNMLFARCISNGSRFYCPDVFSGPVYTPEEMEDVKTEDVPHVEIKAEDHRAELLPTPQPGIGNHVHAKNALAKCATMQEVVTAWKRMTPETLSHPVVEDERNAKVIEIINGSSSITDLNANSKLAASIYIQTDKAIATIKTVKEKTKELLESQPS